MAAVTITRRYLVALGPVRMEIAQLSSVDDADTYSSLLQNPLFGLFQPNTDDNGTDAAANVAISGKTITLNNSGLSATTGVLLLFGF